MNSFDSEKGSYLATLDTFVLGLFLAVSRLTLLGLILAVVGIHHEDTDEAYRTEFMLQLHWFVIAALVCLAGECLAWRSHKEKPAQIKKLRNLLSGSIDAKLSALPAAYEFFAKTKGVRVVNLSDQLDTMRRVRVNFLYNGSVLGVMDLRLQEQRTRFVGQDFIEQIQDASKIVDILGALNNMQIYMGQQNLLSYGHACDGAH